MPQIIDLNDLVGDDVIFRYGKPAREYAIPGDIDVDTVFTLFEMYLALGKMEGDDPDQLAEDLKRRFTTIKEQLLEVLRVRDPDLAAYPFGIRGTGIVLRSILSAFNVNVQPDSPTPPSPARKKPRAAAGRRR